MRLVHLSDLHLGYRQFQRQNAAGINLREADIAQTFAKVVDRVIALQPDLVLIAGDVFQSVRPPNPAILQAFAQFAKLTTALPSAIVVMVAGNHDTPRSTEAGCILRLFRALGIHVVDGAVKRLAFPDRELSVLAVPDTVGERVAFEVDESARYNVLVLHGELPEVRPSWAAEADRAALEISTADIRPEQWSYVALGHHHVFRQIAPNAYYSGAMEYASVNIWGELAEERAAKLPGKGFIEYNLETRKRTFHPIKPARQVLDLHPIQATGLTAADLDAAIAASVSRAPGGIDDKIVRLVVRDVPRHVVRELDHRVLREYRKRALHFHLDARRPELIRTTLGAVSSRRPSLAEIVRDHLQRRTLTPDIDRAALVALGEQYLHDAAAREAPSMIVAEGEPGGGSAG